MMEYLSENDEARKLVQEETPVGEGTGMIWSAFRPSDDPCAYHFHIPSQMLAVVVLGYMEEMFRRHYQDAQRAAQCRRMQGQVKHGIQAWGIVSHPRFGEIYAYEVDGIGNVVLMDDANIPSLLAAPWFGFCSREDALYQRTRRFVLSRENPSYVQGVQARGVGSPHRKGVWHLSLVIQAWTAADKQELQQVVEMIVRTTGGREYLHEAFDPNDPREFSREWFAMTNSLFAAFIIEQYGWASEA